MVSREDRRAAQLVLVLAAAGLAVRLFLGADVPGGSVLYRADRDAPRPTRDSLVSRATRLGRPLAPGERIDVNTAAAEDLVRLPRIGPALAGRIVAHRAEHGPFVSVDDLDRVPGIGPAVIKSVRAHVEASGQRRPRVSSSSLTVMLNTATVEELAQLPGIGLGRARAIVLDRRDRGLYRDADDLLRVRGIGPAIVERIKRMKLP